MQPYVATKQWKDGFGAGETRITAADLTRMESGISAATQGVTNVENKVFEFKAQNTADLTRARQEILDAAQSLVPVGTVVAYCGAQAPTGWIICDGQLLNKTAYSKLFQVLGTVYGSSGNDYFRVPDLRKRFIAGAGNGYGLGTQAGADFVTLTRSQMPLHSHDIVGKAGQAAASGVGLYASNVGGGSGWQVLSTTEQGSVSGIKAKDAGGDQQHENRPPFTALFYIIKAQ